MNYKTISLKIFLCIINVWACRSQGDLRNESSQFEEYRIELLSQIGYTEEIWKNTSLKWANLEDCKFQRLCILGEMNTNFIINGFHYDFHRINVESKYKSSALASGLNEFEHRLIFNNPELIDLISIGYLDDKYPFKINNSFLTQIEFIKPKEGEVIGELSIGMGSMSLLLGIFNKSIKTNIYLEDKKLVKYTSNKLSKLKKYINPQNVNTFLFPDLELNHNKVDKLVINNMIYKISLDDLFLNQIKRIVKPKGKIYVINYLGKKNCKGEKREIKRIQSIFKKNGFTELSLNKIENKYYLEYTL